MYTCEICGARFEPQESYTGVSVDGTKEKITALECPDCGSAEVTELNECIFCGAIAKDDYCEDCAEEITAGLRKITEKLFDKAQKNNQPTCDYDTIWAISEELEKL